MRRPQIDAPRQARTTTLIDTFREFMRTRMLWAVSGVIGLSVLSGLLFLKPEGMIPLQNQTAPAAQQQTEAAEPASTTAEPLPTADTEAPAAAGSGATASAQGSSAAAAGATTPATSTSTSPLPETSERLQPCDTATKRRIERTRQEAITAENERYRNLTSGGLLGLVGGLLGGGPTAAQIQEHNTILQQIEIRYRQQLRQAGCA